MTNIFGFEGYGSNTRGGYGLVGTDPVIVKVTNLDASGPGSLKEALESSGPRIIVFEVSGIINQQSYIYISDPYVTVAGQTAPSPGICLRGGLWIDTHDVIIQHIRVRAAKPIWIQCDWQDSIQIGESGYNPYNIVIDHCSVSWACDENATTWYEGHDITWQWNIISEGFLDHSCGTLTSPDIYNTSVHHNYFAHNQVRTPFIRSYGNNEVINNVVYNWQDDACQCGAEYNAQYLHILGNYYKRGSGNAQNYGGISVWQSANSGSRYYIHDNISPPYRTSNTQDDWDCVACNDQCSKRSNTPLFTQNINPIAINDVFENVDMVLAKAGARLIDRDAELVDKRVINNFYNTTGSFISHQDEVGGFPNLAQNNQVLTTPINPHEDHGDGYTNLEHWLQDYADIVAGTNGTTPPPPPGTTPQWIPGVPNEYIVVGVGVLVLLLLLR